MKKSSKYFQGISRFFNPQKSGTNAVYDKYGGCVKLGTHQYGKMLPSKFYAVIPNRVVGGVIQPHVGKW